MDQLNARQKMFCREYIKDWNATQAAIRAGYSERTAGQQGSRLLTNVKIQKHIEQAIEDALGAQRAQVRYIVIQQLLPIAQYEATDDSEIVTETVERPIYDNEGNETGEVETREVQVVRHNDTANSTNRKAIAGLKQNEKGVIEVKYHDKLKALELLGRYGGLWNDKLEVTGAGGGPIEHIDYSNMSEEEARKKYLELLQDRQ